MWKVSIDHSVPFYHSYQFLLALALYSYVRIKKEPFEPRQPIKMMFFSEHLSPHTDSHCLCQSVILSTKSLLSFPSWSLLLLPVSPLYVFSHHLLSEFPVCWSFIHLKKKFFTTYLAFYHGLGYFKKTRQFKKAYAVWNSTPISLFKVLNILICSMTMLLWLSCVLEYPFLPIKILLIISPNATTSSKISPRTCYTDLIIPLSISPFYFYFSTYFTLHYDWLVSSVRF